MKFNINTDMLVKHRFWVILGVAMAMSLVGIFMLQFGADANAVMSKLKGQITGAKDLKAKTSDKTREAHEKNAKFAADLETDIWSRAFAAQAPLFKWSEKIEKEFNFFDGLFATDVKLEKRPSSVKEWPPTDPPGGAIGILTNVEATSFTIETRVKQQFKTFKKTPSMEDVTLIAGTPQKIRNNLMKDHLGKLVTVTYQQGRYFGDNLTQAEQDDFRASYKEQFKEILEQIDPLKDTGDGVVQLKDWLYSPGAPPEGLIAGVGPPFFRYVTQAWKQETNNSKDAWIAQENLWIQKEIYRLIADANKTVSKFKSKGLDIDEKHTFENAYFEVKLKLDRTNKELSFEIKNRTSRRQKLDLEFRAQLNTFQAESIRPSGDPLMPAGSGENKDTFKQIFPVDPKEPARNGIYGLEQVLNFETAAVKRVDHISIGSNEVNGPSHSHRTYADGLRAFEVETKLHAEAKPDDPKLPVPPPPLPVVGLGVAGTGNRAMTPYDQWSDRYIEPPNQARRIPVAVALIVAQEHVDRVLTQFTNSKLRLLLTQVLLNHHHGSLAPPKAVAPVGPKGLPPIGIPNRAAPGGGGGGGGELETNMELVMYGVMTLYQRYPPRNAPTPIIEKK